MLIKEYWKQILGFEGYYGISNLGNVISLHYNKTIRLRPKIKNGYRAVALSKHGKRIEMNISRLVGIHWLDYNKDASNLQINHKNGNKLDDRVSNLEWVTSKENVRHAYKIGKNKSIGTTHGMAKLTEDDIFKINNMRISGASIREIAVKFNVHWSTIYRNLSCSLNLVYYTL